MAVRFRCVCGGILEAPDSARGGRVQCPTCSAHLKIPAATPKMHDNAVAHSQQNLRGQVTARPITPAQDLPEHRQPATQPQTTSRIKVAAQPVSPAKRKVHAASQATAVPVRAAAEPNAQTVAQSPGSLQDEFEAFGPGASKAWQPAPTGTSNWPVFVLLGSAGLLLLAVVLGAAFWFGGSVPEIAASPEKNFVSASSQNDATVASSERGDEPGTDQSESRPALIGRTPEETEMLQVATEFIRFARRNDSQAAIGMIDRQLFHKRAHRKEGSWEALRYNLSAEKLLSNVARYSLDRLEAPAGRRHWDVLGTSEFSGTPGVVIRYFVEPKAPAEIYRYDSQLLPIVRLIEDYDEFEAVAGGIYAAHEVKHSRYDAYELGAHAIHRTQPQRVGYLLLTMESREGGIFISDIINLLGQTALSQTCGLIYMDDYHIFGTGFGEQPDTLGAPRLDITIFGASPIVTGFSWSSEAEYERKKAEEARLVAEVAEQRPQRLAHTWKLLAQNAPEAAEEVQRFKRDFPGDHGVEMAHVIHSMMPEKRSWGSSKASQLQTAANDLYDVWNDPFLIYVQALTAVERDDLSAASQQFSKARQLGFQTTGMHQFFIDQAIRNESKSELLKALSDLGRFWDQGSTGRDQKVESRFKARWQACLNTINPPPSFADVARNSRPNFGAGSGRSFPDRNDSQLQPDTNGQQSAGENSAREFFEERFNRGRPGGMDQRGPNQRGPNSARRERGRPGQDGAETGKQVVVKISSNDSFDSTKLMHRLRSKLGIGRASSSQRNKEATLRLHYDGELQTVVDAIDFGIVQSTDAQTNTIVVTIP